MKRSYGLKARMLSQYEQALLLQPFVYSISWSVDYEEHTCIFVIRILFWVYALEMPLKVYFTSAMARADQL